MSPRRFRHGSVVACVAVLALGVTQCPSGTGLQQLPDVLAGHVEPHTPGSGDPLEAPLAPTLQRIRGAGADLNRISYTRTLINDGDAIPPRAILILVPGFLGGAATFDPLARDLVSRFNGTLEVWAVDRRPNQFEDRRGVQHARQGLLAASPTALAEGVQFYFPDSDVAPLGDFPGPGDFDVDADGVLDPPFALPDASGGSSAYQSPAQDDVRFTAYWGIDTYARDWKLLVDRARQWVGEDGLVLFGGHSMGTTFATVFAAYDFDPGPGVDAGHAAIDGLLLLEGGGSGPARTSVCVADPTLLCSSDATCDSAPGAGDGVCDPLPDPGDVLAAYQAAVLALATPGGPDLFLADFNGIAIQQLGPGGELSALGAVFEPNAETLLTRTPLFGQGLAALLFSVPVDNRAAIGLFADDDHSPVTAFRASMGFSDNGINVLLTTFGPPFYVAATPIGDTLRRWKDFDDPTLPVCGPGDNPALNPGCALIDNGPKPAPGAPPAIWGQEREVTSLDTFARTQFAPNNGLEWYFLSGRISLDLGFGRDSSLLSAGSLALDPSDEGPLVVTQNAAVDVPVLAIGGSNGLTPTEDSFAGYFASIATPTADKRAEIIEGYAHIDPLTAESNEAVPLVADWITDLLVRKLLASL